MRSQIAKEKARLLGFSRGWSVGDGMGRVVLDWCPENDAQDVLASLSS
jgi:hypothetical protein